MSHAYPPDFNVGLDFAKGAIEWIGIKQPVGTDYKLNCSGDEPLSITLTIMLDANDIKGIGEAMRKVNG